MGSTRSSSRCVIGTSNSSTKNISHLISLGVPSNLQVLNQRGACHNYAKTNSKKPRLDSLLFHALSFWRCTFIFIFPRILYNSRTSPPSELHSFYFHICLFYLLLLSKHAGCQDLNSKIFVIGNKTVSTLFPKIVSQTCSKSPKVVAVPQNSISQIAV